MIKNKIILILIFLSPILGLGQTLYTIKGNVTDPEKKKIANARVFFSETPSRFVYTDSEGNFTIKLNYSNPTELLVSSVSYEQKKILINKSVLRKAKNKVVNLNIKLSYRTLKEIIVRSKKRPDTIFSSKVTSVSDYEFIGDHMVLLSYERSLKKAGFLQLTSKENTLITTYKTPPRPKRLFKDFENNLYLITEYKVFLISVVRSEIRLRPVDKKQFYELTTRIIDTCSSHFFYSDFNPDYPAFNYYSQPINDTVAKVLHHVENSFMMDLYRAEFKYAPPRQKLWAFRQELKTGIDKEIWIGANNFTQSIYYEPLYAPLFVNQDTLLIFDHYSDFLFKINTKNFSKTDSIPIFYHKNKDKKNWEQPILKDKDEHKLYGLFLKHGYYYLKPINLNDGSTLFSFKLNYKYVENVKVENGFVYYIYRPFESSQKKYLYREIIDFDVPKSN